jgi:NADH-quinone oxidoreductase subunit G
MIAAAPHLAALDAVVPASGDDVGKLAGVGGTPEKSAFVSPVADFYLTNPIARASATLAECSVLASGRKLTAAE